MTMKHCSINRSLTGALLLSLVLIAGLAGAQITQHIPGDPLRIEGGLVSGTMGNGVKMYLGVPFAAPPIRENRWRAPQPVIPWKGVWTADKMPPECLQRLRATTTNQYFGDELSGEDCLYLNIWAPASARPSHHLPVIVYIYGGAFYIGSASMPLYSGEQIASKGVIYVAANYRLGVMGFLAHPDASAESGHHASGNWGLLDQIAALQWVKNNIAVFGGDPTNVTLVGQSAGSMSINHLQISPLAEGLFRRIIGMSGSALGGAIPADPTLAAAELQGLQLQRALNAKNLKEMRTIPADKVFAVSQTAGGRMGPIVDGYVVPEAVADAFSEGKQIDVPVLTGSTANDIGTNPPIRAVQTLQEYEAVAARTYGSSSAELLQLFPAHNDNEARNQAEQIGEDSGFAVAARAWAKDQTVTGKQPAYLYFFKRVQPFAPGVSFSDLDPATAGAYHTSDVPYWLGTYGAFNLLRHTRDWTPWDRKLSSEMQDVIVHFARSGDPSTPSATFVPYDSSNEVRLVFGDTIAKEVIDSKAMDFLASHPASQAGGPHKTQSSSGEDKRPASPRD
jgi:para-nitrobenzyl esterase